MVQSVRQWVESIMPVVTGIETQKNRAERVNVYLDGQFAFGASALVAASYHLTPGRELSEAEVEALQADESAEQAYNSALNYLSFRPRSARELQDYFRRKGIAAEPADAALARLRRIGLVDDEAFAKFWIENRQNFRPRGARALRAELYRKGVDRETVDEALETAGDEEQNALNAARKKAGSWRALDEREFAQRLIGFLQRRGFAYAVGARVAQQLLSERGGELDDDELPLDDDEPAG